jgi:hypothetical protein
VGRLSGQVDDNCGREPLAHGAQAAGFYFRAKVNFVTGLAQSRGVDFNRRRVRVQNKQEIARHVIATARCRR